MRNRSLKNAYKFLVLAVLLLALGGAKASGQTGDINQLVREGNDALDAWDYARAGQIAEQMLVLADQESEVAAARMFRASYFFYAADYEKAGEELRLLAEIRELGDYHSKLRKRVEKLSKLWSGAPEARSEHFIVRYVNPKDKVLIEPSLATLEASYQSLVGDLGIDPGAPVLVEVYPSFEDFSAATGLGEEDLENSGTIAVCKYRRLMINSPRILVRGYAYRDTLCHEFVHFLIYQKYGPSTPIWVHEGIAKYLERSWRGDKSGALLPSQQSLLAAALRMDELITFDRMHPSFALLKTPRQGQLAFAEVATAIGYMVDKGGWPLVFRLCDELLKTPDYSGAVESAFAMPFDRFWKEWVSHAKKQGYRELQGMEITVYEIRKGDPEFEDEDVLASDLEEGDHWKFVRLGDLLRDRGHFQAAAVEYRKAREAAPYSPRVLNKLGLCLYLAGDYEAALEPLELAVKIVPSFSTSHVNLGRTLVALERNGEAEKAFLDSLDINPFNPIPYGYLLKIYDNQGREREARALAKNYQLISE